MFCGLLPAGAVVKMNAEHHQLQWLPLEEARERLMWPSDRAAVEEALAQILLGGPAKAFLRIDVSVPPEPSHK